MIHLHSFRKTSVQGWGITPKQNHEPTVINKPGTVVVCECGERALVWDGLPSLGMIEEVACV
jgi:hypothetical protein